MRRAVETAAVVGAELGLDVREDERLRERMNWEGGETIDDFLDRWGRASAERSFVPEGGDSSADAARRFLAALEDITTESTRTAVVVAHGGVTTDTLRTLLGDEELERRAPGIIEAGIPGGAVTTLERTAGGWAVDAIVSSTTES